MFEEEKLAVNDGVGEQYLPERRTVGNLFPGRRLAEDTAPASWTVFRQHVRDNSTDWRFTPGYVPESDAMSGAIGADLDQVATEVAEHIKAQQQINERNSMSKAFFGIMTVLLLLVVLLSIFK